MGTKDNKYSCHYAEGSHVDFTCSCHKHLLSHAGDVTCSSHQMHLMSHAADADVLSHAADVTGS